MLYHVIRRSPHYNNKNNDINFSTNSTSSSRNGTIPKLMSRYHYSRVNTPQNATASSESFFPRQKSNVTNATTMTTTSNNNNSNSYTSFKSTFIPLTTTTRTLIPNKREFIQIPITREDGTSLTTNASRSVPITFISETTPLPTTTTTTSNIMNGSATYSKQPYSNLLRPGSRYSRYHQHHHSHGSGDESSAISTSRLPPVTRRLSLTAPIMTNSSTSLKIDDESTKSPVSSPSSPIIRQIPIQFSQPTNAASIPTNSSRISSAVLRSSSLSHPPNSQLKRQKTDLGDIPSSDFTTTLLNTSPIRRAEVMAREAIQGVARFQQQQQRNDAITDNTTTNNLTSIRSPGASRRVLVNLKNNQSVSLDSRLSSANNSFSRQAPSASRLTQRNNFFNIPISHEIQIPSHPVTLPAETSFNLPQSPLISNRKTTNGSSSSNSCFQSEFRTEIPIQVITSTEQENSIQENEEKQDGIVDYDQPITIITERIPSANGNSNQALKSILKRSSSRDNVPRKSVTFMHA